MKIAKPFIGNKAGRELIDKGFLPKLTVDFQVVVNLNEPVALVTKSYLDVEQYREFLEILGHAVDAPTDRAQIVEVAGA